MIDDHDSEVVVTKNYFYYDSIAVFYVRKVFDLPMIYLVTKASRSKVEELIDKVHCLRT